MLGDLYGYNKNVTQAPQIINRKSLFDIHKSIREESLIAD